MENILTGVISMYAAGLFGGGAGWLFRAKSVPLRNNVYAQ